LFFDFIGHHHIDLWQHFSDGYKLEGSPFYGTVSFDFNQNTNLPVVKKTYLVKLEHFIDKFDTPLCRADVHFISFLFALGLYFGLKILYSAMNQNLNYLFVYCTFVRTENSLNARHPMRKRCVQLGIVRHAQRNTLKTL
jgi:hypothetical protein